MYPLNHLVQLKLWESVISTVVDLLSSVSETQIPEAAALANSRMKCGGEFRIYIFAIIIMDWAY